MSLCRPLWRSGASSCVRVYPRPVSGADRSGLPAGLVCFQRLELSQLCHRGGGGATQVSHTSATASSSNTPADCVSTLLSDCTESQLVDFWSSYNHSLDQKCAFADANEASFNLIKYAYIFILYKTKKFHLWRMLELDFFFFVAWTNSF